MKDQYFGDVNDFRKYGLLRTIATHANLHLGICWMLTAPDSRNDGRQLAYLKKPSRYRPSDPELFDWLTGVVHHESDRRTARIEATNLLGEAIFYSAMLTDNRQSRRSWFAKCRESFRDCDVIFFDPDNGLERSVAYGHRNSCKFLYWTEVRDIFGAGASIVIYQHFPREPRDEFINRLADQLRSETAAPTIFSFRTPTVLFLAASHERHGPWYRSAISKLKSSWPTAEIEAKEH